MRREEGNDSTLAAPDAGGGSTLHAPAAAAAAGDLPALGEVDPSAYALGGELARGGMGRIIAARDRRLRRPVAIKLLLAHGPAAARRFEREALITARLQHPSIVRVYEAGRWPDGQPFYAMEKVRGRSLDKVIADAGGLDGRLALLPSVIAVAEALAYAHSEGIVHRDLKPANVLVGDFGETVVIDWGLAKDIRDVDTIDEATGESSPSLPDLTVAGTVMGTPAFMAPEQARGEEVDERTDVYALGAMLYALLAGEPPYRGRSSDEIIEQVVTGQRRALAERVPGAPAELCAIVDRAMAVVREQRYATARELADDLERFAAGQLVAAHRYSRGRLLVRWLRRHRVPVMIALAAAMVLAIVGALAVHQVVRERDRADRERVDAVGARADAEAARRLAEQRADEMVFEQARSSFDADPSTALAWLKQLSPAADWAAARALAVDAAARGVARELAGHGDDVEYVAFAPVGAWLASGSDNGSIRLWTVDGTPGRSPAGHGAPIEGMIWSADGRVLVTASPDGTARLAQADTGAGRVLAHGAGVRGVAASADGTKAATGGVDGRVVVWTLGPDTARELGRHQDTVRGLAFSSDGGTVFSVADDGALGIWPITGGRPKIIAAHGSVARAIAVSPDGALIATGGEDGKAKLWTRDGAPVRTLGVHNELVRDVLFTPDGRWVASAGGDNLVRLVAVDGSGERVLEGNTSGIKDIALSADGSLLASAGIDGTVHVWPVAGGPPRVLRGHRGSVKAVSFAPDGHWLASGSDDDHVRVWPLQPLPAPPEGAGLRAWLDQATNINVARGRPAPR